MVYNCLVCTVIDAHAASKIGRGRQHGLRDRICTTSAIVCIISSQARWPPILSLQPTKYSLQARHQAGYLASETGTGRKQHFQRAPMWAFGPSRKNEDDEGHDNGQRTIMKNAHNKRTTQKAKVETKTERREQGQHTKFRTVSNYIQTITSHGDKMCRCQRSTTLVYFAVDEQKTHH